VIKILIAFLLLSSVCYAGQRELDIETSRVSTEGRQELSTQERDQLLTRGWRNNRVGEFYPPVRETARPDDYIGQFDRGTIGYTQAWQNYSRHKIMIPDGTVIDGEILGACNFAQIEPDTDAILRRPGFGHNLTFRSCNLVNVRSYDDWVIEGSNTSQADVVVNATQDGLGTQEDTVYISKRSKDVPRVRVLPTNRIKKDD